MEHQNSYLLTNAKCKPNIYCTTTENNVEIYKKITYNDKQIKRQFDLDGSYLKSWNLYSSFPSPPLREKELDVT